MLDLRLFDRSLLRLVVLELLLAPAPVIAWVLIGAADQRVLGPLIAVRTIIAAVHLRVLLGPFLALRSAATEADDARLLAVEASLQHLGRRFVVAYAVGWLVAQLASLGLAAAGIPDVLPLAQAELLAAGLLTFVVTLIFPGFVAPMIQAISNAGLLELAPKLAERGLEPRTPEASFGFQLTLNASLLTLANMLGFGTVTGKQLVDADRDQARIELASAVELAAVRGQLPSEAEAGSGLDASIVASSELPPPLGAQLESGAETTSLSTFDHRQERVLAAAPLEDERWLLAEAEPDERLGERLLLLLFLAVGVLAPLVLSANAMSRSMIEPLTRLQDAIRSLVEVGKLRGSARLPRLRGDEIGTLTQDFNALLDMLEDLAEAVTTVAEGQLRVELNHPGELHEGFAFMVERLREVVESIRETALEVATATAEINAGMQEQDEAAQEQVEGVQRTAQNVAALGEAATGIAHVADGVQRDAAKSLDTVDAMTRSITELGVEAGRIAELLDAIREIASRSDLLALNGSLEATRAGEAGRGFALVAAEMRRLAERITGLVADVDQRVSAIQLAGQAAVSATESSRQLAEQTAVAATQIVEVTRSQSQQTGMAISASLAMTEFVKAAAAATTHTRATADGLQAQVEELERLTGRFELD